jgi:hypothetical protein
LGGSRPRLGGEPGAGQRLFVAAVILEPDDLPVTHRDDDARLPVRQAPLGERRPGHLDEQLVTALEDPVEAGDDALALSLAQCREHLVAAVAVPVAHLIPEPLHIGVHELAQRFDVPAQERLERGANQIGVAHAAQYPATWRATARCAT